MIIKNIIFYFFSANIVSQMPKTFIFSEFSVDRFCVNFLKQGNISKLGSILTSHTLQMQLNGKITERSFKVQCRDACWTKVLTGKEVWNLFLCEQEVVAQQLRLPGHAVTVGPLSKPLNSQLLGSGRGWYWAWLVKSLWIDVELWRTCVIINLN